MAWEIFAIWAVVIATIAWFVHEERRLIANASLAQASFLYPRAPKGEATSPAPVGTSRVDAAPRRQQELGPASQEFIQALSQAR